MNFDLSDDERLIADSVERLLAREYDFAHRERYFRSGDGWSREIWSQFAELGVLGLPFGEDAGGFGGGPTALLIVGQALGRVLALEPFLATMVLAGGALELAGDSAQRERWLSALIGGDQIFAFAHDEAGSRGRPDHIETRAAQHGHLWRLSGRKSLVLHGGSADVLVVSALDPSGEPALFVVHANAPGMSRRVYKLHDGRPVADIAFEGADAERLAGPANGAVTLRKVLQRGTAALCAETLGAMEAFLALTLDYLKTRSQFGRPIGSNQALQHRAVDLRIGVEEARSAALIAIDALSATDDAQRAHALAQAKFVLGQIARKFGQEAVQLHGSIALTEEYVGSHYFRRLMAFEHLFGETDAHLSVLADLVA